jgi:hypothetical protein
MGLKPDLRIVPLRSDLSDTAVPGNQGVSAAIRQITFAIELGIADLPRYGALENSPPERGSKS